MTSASVGDIALSIAIKRIHDMTLECVRELSGAQLRWQANPGSPPIAFHLWHMARWADMLQAMISSARSPDAPAEQVWLGEGLAERWGLTGAGLTADATGMGLDDELSAALTLPSFDLLVDYAERSFKLAGHTVRAAVEGGHLGDRCIELHGRETILVEPIPAHFGHLSRHLGMIEALIGVQGAGQG